MTAPAPAEDEKPDLSAQLEDIINKAQSIVDTATAAGRDLSPDEDREHRSLTDRAEKIGETINRNQTLARIRSAAAADGRHLRIERGAAGGDAYDRDPLGDPRDTGGRRRNRDPWKLGEVEQWGRSRSAVAAEYRSRALDAAALMPGASDKIRAAATEIIEQFDDEDAKLSRAALALSDPAYARAFSKTARDPQSPDLDEHERSAVANVRQFARALNLTDTASGYLIPFQLDPTVQITAMGSRNDIRKIARQVVATSDVWHGVTAGAVEWSWDGEATEVSDDSPTFAQPSIPIYKAAGFVPISLEALADASNITAEVAKLFAFGKDILESAAFSIGSGVGQPAGVVTSLIGSGSIVPAATNDTLAVGDLYNMQSALPARHRANASWLAPNSFYNRARQFDQNGGSALWAQLGDDRPAQLLGKPVYECEDMDGTINATQHNYMAIFGDFENYVIADRIGVSVEFLPMLMGPNRRPNGQRGWYAYYRTGAGVTDPTGLRMLDV